MPGDTLEEFLAPYSPEVKDLVMQARLRVNDTIPGLIEIVDPPSKIIAFGFSSRYRDLVCAIALYKTYVNLMFARGTELPDPNHLLEGAGKHARHVRIRQPDGIQNPGLPALLQAALALTQGK